MQLAGFPVSLGLDQGVRPKPYFRGSGEMEMDSHETGTLPGSGSFRCADCGYVLSLITRDKLPPCPSCGGTEYARASFLIGERAEEPPPATPEETAPLLARVRAELVEPGEYLVYEDGDELQVVPLTKEWTRIGRSLAADVRFDDPTVSRRHALLVRAPDRVRVLDDRSMNGVFVNGERVEWSTLADGDEIMVGRHSLRFLEISVVSGLRPGTPDGIPLSHQ
jgi:hypothetical protein